MYSKPKTKDIAQNYSLNYQRRRYAVGALLALGLLLRTYGLQRIPLWYDDVFGPLFAQQTIFDMLVCLARFDIHPPLWNLQLWLWASAGTSDSWFLLNSVFWSMAALYSLYWVAKRHFGYTTAWLALLLFALNPFAVTMAREVRMYPLLMFLLIWAFHANYLYFTEKTSRRQLGWVLLAGVALTYTHGTGLLLAGYIGVFGLIVIRQSGVSAAVIRPWLICQSLVVLLGLPAIGNALVRSPGHVVRPNAEMLMNTISGLFFGPMWTGAGQGWKATWVVAQPTPWIALALFATLIVGGLYFARSRPQVMALVLVPVAATALVSFTFKPIWSIKTFLPLLPFFCLGWAQVLVLVADKFSGKGRAVFQGASILGLSLGLGLGTYKYLGEHQKSTNFKAAVAELKPQLKPGDVVWVPLNFDFWATAWYLHGPDWGSPLAVQDLAGPQTGKWKQILAKTDPKLLSRFHLLPKKNYLEKDGVRLYIGHGAQEEILKLKPKTIYTLQTDLMEKADWSGVDIFSEVSLDWTRPLSLPGYQQKAKRGYTRLWVKKYLREGVGEGEIVSRNY